MAKAKKGNDPKVVTISGVVEELELDDDDIGLQIVDSGRVHRVVMDRQGRKLLDYVDEAIEATGFIIKSAGGNEIKIARFHLADEAGADEDEEDEEEAEDWSGEDDDFMDDRYED